MVRKGEPVLGICVNSSQNELLLIPGCKESSVADLPPGDWLFSLRDGAVLGLCCWEVERLAVMVGDQPETCEPTLLACAYVLYLPPWLLYSHAYHAITGVANN